MTTEIKNKIQELKSLRDRATQGEWINYREIFGNSANKIARTHLNISTLVCIAKSGKLNGVNDDKFIAESANRWIDLLECLEMAVDALEEYSDLHYAPKLEEALNKIQERIKG